MPLQATDRLKALVSFALSCGELVADLADGVSFSLISKLVAVAREAGPALSGAATALVQYANMTDAEAADLEQFVVTEFDIDQNDIEAVVEGALKLAIQLHELVKYLLPKAA